MSFLALVVGVEEHVATTNSRVVSEGPCVLVFHGELCGDIFDLVILLSDAGISLPASTPLSLEDVSIL